MTGFGAQAAAAKVDATNYTVSCDTLIKGAVQFKPTLTLSGGGGATATTIKGTLEGCNATPNDSNPAVTVISGSVKGLVTAPDNGCLSLLGPSSATGTITITWKTVPALTNAKTVITINNGNISGGTITPFGDSATYGKFDISGTSQTGAFGGPSGTGAASFTHSLTVEGVNTLTASCSGAKGLKGVTLGSTELSLG